MNGYAADQRGIVLSLRLRALHSSGSVASVSWADSSPAAALALDVARASGGAPDPPRGAVLPARFLNLQSALLAARRIGWALDGLAESAGSTTVADLAIHLAGDPLALAFESSGTETGPGRVLLSGNLAEAIQQLPGLSLRPAAGSDWRELEWRPEDRPASLALDEQSVLGLIRALGRQDPVPPLPASPPTATLSPLTPGRGFEPPTGIGRPYADPQTAPSLWKKPWVVISAAAAGVVLAAVLVISAIVGHPKSPGADGIPKAVPPITPSHATSPATVSSAGQTPQSKATVKSGKQPRNAGKGEPTSEAKTEAKTEPKIESKIETLPPRQQAGSCALTEGEIPNSLSRAERLMYEGKLAEAQSAFQRLVGCSSAREKALEGLQRVKQRIAASPSSQ